MRHEPAELLSGVTQLEGAVTETSPFKPAEVLRMHADRQVSVAASVPPHAAAVEHSAAQHADVPGIEAQKAPVGPAEAPAPAQMSRHVTSPLLPHLEAARCPLPKSCSDCTSVGTNGQGGSRAGAGDLKMLTVHAGQQRGPQQALSGQLLRHH